MNNNKQFYMLAARLIGIFCLLALPLKASYPAHGLVLPPIIPVTTGITKTIYYDNIAILEDVHSIEVECELGIVGTDAWTLTAAADDFGIYPFSIRLYDASELLLAEAHSLIAVNPPAPFTGDLRIMIIGDSLSNNGGFQNRMRSRMDTAEISFSTVGTVERGGMWGESHGGNTYQRYLEGPHNFRSPFVYSDTGFDPNRYFDTEMDGIRPTLYIIFLGINDTFAGSNSNAEGKETRIDTMMARAITFIDGMRAAASGSEVALVLTPAGSSEQSAFDAAYGEGIYTPTRWHDMRQRLVKRYIEVFGGRETEGIHLIPVSVGIDRLLDYPATDPIHPNTSGHHRIGDILFSWINHYLNEHSYSRWALDAFSTEALLAGAAAKEQTDAPGKLPMIARYWFNLPATQATHQPLKWNADGLSLSHRSGAPIAIETSTDLIDWNPWNGIVESMDNGVSAQHLIPHQAMDKAQQPKRFWRVAINPQNN